MTLYIYALENSWGHTYTSGHTWIEINGQLETTRVLKVINSMAVCSTMHSLSKRLIKVYI